MNSYARLNPLKVAIGLLCWALGQANPVPAEAKSSWAEIRVLDDLSGQGVPLVELETVNGLKFVTDNAGRIAFQEPGLMGREVFFTVRSHGYEFKKDGFGIAGTRLVPVAGQVFDLKITRKNLAERLCRLTGEGTYRDTLLLGYKAPISDSPHPGRVAGQDTVQATIYRGKIFWFWGDTQTMGYPLGLFRTAGATTPSVLKDDLRSGIAYDYFVDPKSQFARAMFPLPQRPEGVIWVDSLFVVADPGGKERMLTHYSRRKGLADELEQGIAVFDDKTDTFSPVNQLSLKETWRHPHGHPILFEEAGKRWLLFGSPNPNVRCPATWAGVLDPKQYEALTCEKSTKGEPDIGPDGRPKWRWQKEVPPTTSPLEAQWIKNGRLKQEQARFVPCDQSSPKDSITLHSGTVRWNAFRSCWILLAGQVSGKASYLGEVWYSESDHPTWPFRHAVRVVTHDRQSFYNVCQHAFLDRDGGRQIHFEGTYTNDFSGNPDKTPRYNYNQMLYRLDVDKAASKLPPR